jgi:lipoprotein-anchoring transpeptidase ErfK/SrfK
MRATNRAIALIAALLAGATLLAACTSGGPGGTVTQTVTAPAPTVSAGGSSSTPPASASTPAPTSSSPTAPAQTVRVTSMQSDGATYGVGMPIVLYFSPLPTDSTAFTKAVKVTVNGKPADGAWYWEQPTADEVQSHTYEAHYRLPHYWPAHAKIHVDIPIGGLSAGKGLVYSDKLTSLDFAIGAKRVAKVNGATEKMHVYSDDRLVKTIPVSLGEADHPTYEGTKVVMQKGEDVPGTDRARPHGQVRMVGPGYDLLVAWSVRITRSGEYVHAAPWNSLIGRQSTSHGCTNLSTANADWFYHFARIGDVLTYTRTGGRTMPSWDGLGDWNVTWPVWARGGLLLNH